MIFHRYIYHFSAVLHVSDHLKSKAPHPIPHWEVKPLQAWLVLSWGTRREVHVLLTFLQLFFTFCPPVGVPFYAPCMPCYPWWHLQHHASASGTIFDYFLEAKWGGLYVRVCMEREEHVLITHIYINWLYLLSSYIFMACQMGEVQVTTMFSYKRYWQICTAAPTLYAAQPVRSYMHT